jgi:hypothetical protein
VHIPWRQTCGNARPDPGKCAVRKELGEEKEPLPAEIYEAVKEVRRRIAEIRG